MNQEQENKFIKMLERMTNGIIGCNAQNWNDFSPKVRIALFKHIYEFEFDEETPNIDVSMLSWNELPERFARKLESNLEEYARVVYESEHNL